jgi:hypothetical protein
MIDALGRGRRLILQILAVALIAGWLSALWYQGRLRAAHPQAIEGVQ